MPEERAQVGAENVPVPPVVQITVPVGEEPVTVAVHTDATVTVTDEGAQVTEVVEMLGAKLNVSTAQPSLNPG